MMQEFGPGYLAYLYEQISSISAILGGFSIAALTVLLTARVKQTLISWATGTAALASTILISTTFLASILASDAMKTDATKFDDITASVQPLIGMVGLLFPAGIYMLLACVGLCGWARSRGTGITTTLAALLGILLVTLGFIATVQ